MLELLVVDGWMHGVCRASLPPCPSASLSTKETEERQTGVFSFEGSWLVPFCAVVRF